MNYDDLGGLMSGTDQFGKPADLAWSLLGVESCDADLNDDGIVDLGDILILLANWGDCPPECIGDIDDDGTVGFSDLLTVLDRWGAC